MSNYARGAYTNSSTRSPVSLGAAIAINGAVIGALMFASPVVQEKLPTMIRLIKITPDPVPPKAIEPPKQNLKTVDKPTRQQEVITTTTTAVTTDQNFATIVPPRFPIETGTTEIVRPIDPPHDPVLIVAQINPRYRDALQPAYPPGMIRAEKEGVVVIRVLIGADGRVKDVQKVEAADESFYRVTAEQALKRWRFLPATEDGTPKESWKVMTIRFRLDQA